MALFNPLPIFLSNIAEEIEIGYMLKSKLLSLGDLAVKRLKRSGKEISGFKLE